MGAVRIGVLGGGGILGSHAPAYAKIRDLCEVVAVAEPDVKRHDRVKALLGADVRLYADYRDVIGLADVDAVDIVLPHYLHLPATLCA
ncbi:MAG TPA: Gfo/Idh/MocA family oxidoreductase, partial [Candidatus Latescibacteria bacterium]|nr:Gfo/Idh/MocA family oxidoreductase [Candidatus Latescibacterota bacterium]